MKRRFFCNWHAFIFVVALFIFVPSGILQASDLSPELRGDGRLTLYNAARDERAVFKYRDKKGRYNDKEFDEIAEFFRCRLTGESHDIDPRLIEILDAIEDHFNAGEVKIISEYRSPERNAMMRRKSRKVARQSLHMYGRAADIEVPGVSKSALRNFAFSLKQGGVGTYGKRSFVHVDTGDVRTWGLGDSGHAKKKKKKKTAAVHK